MGGECVGAATGINDTGGKYATGGKQWEQLSNCWQNEIENKIYLYANSTTQRCPKEIIKKFSDWRFFPIATGVVDTGGKPWASNISATFRKNSKRPSWYNKGLGGNWFMKKTRSKKSRDTVPLNKLSFQWKCNFLNPQHLILQLSSEGIMLKINYPLKCFELFRLFRKTFAYQVSRVFDVLRMGYVYLL